MTTPTATNVWAQCLRTVAQEVSPQVLKTWFEPLRPLELNQEAGGVELRLGVPSPFYQAWLAEHYGPLLSGVAAAVAGGDARVTFSVHEEAAVAVPEPAAETPPAPRMPPPEAARRTREQPAPAAALRQEAPPLPRAAASPDLQPSTGLNAKYVFDRFVEGACNRLARNASIAIAERPGETSFNPLMIYGGVGLGKTHLAQAIGNCAQARGSVQRMRYVSSEQFTSEFIQAIQRNRIHEFTSFYRQMDLLIVDDVQFFGGKEKTQEEFFHIFNDLHQRGKQVVLCADRAPRDIPGIEERLLSRFQWGLTADVQMPDLETRAAILNQKALAEGTAVPAEVIEFIAERVSTNVRELEGSLIRLLAHSRLQRRAVTLELAQEALRNLVRHETSRLEIGDIQQIVADFYSMEPRLLLGASRKREIVSARHVAMYLCKQHTQSTLKTIGTRFGGRDHSTVIHACSAIEDRLDTEPSFRDEFAALRQKVRCSTRPSAMAVGQGQ